MQEVIRVAALRRKEATIRNLHLWLLIIQLLDYTTRRSRVEEGWALALAKLPIAKYSCNGVDLAMRRVVPHIIRSPLSRQRVALLWVTEADWVRERVSHKFSNLEHLLSVVKEHSFLWEVNREVKISFMLEMHAVSIYKAMSLCTLYDLLPFASLLHYLHRLFKHIEVREWDIRFASKQTWIRMGEATIVVKVRRVL